MMKTGLILTVAGLLALPVLGGFPEAAFGQHAMGDGRHLDNSLQAGSGGVNSPQVMPQYGAGNDIVTGNVGGLQYFHGRVPYRAPGEFHGDLPSNRLFRFNAQSLPPSAGMPGSFPGAVPAGTPIYRSMTGVTVGDVTAGGPNVLVPRDAATLGGYQPIYPAPSGAYVPQRGDGANIGQIQQPSGRLLELNASPLMGLRPDQRSSFDLAPRSVTHGSPGAPVAGPAPNLVTGQQLGPQGEMQRPRLDGDGLLLPQGAQWTPDQLGGPARTIEQRLEALRNHLSNPNASFHVEPGQDVHQEILRKVRERLLRAEGLDLPEAEPARRVGERDQMGLPVPGSRVRPPVKPGMAPPLDAPAAPDGVPGDPFAPDIRPNVPAEPTPALPLARHEPHAMFHAAEGAEGESDATERVIDALSYEMTSLATLAGSTNSEMDRLLREAEQHMAAGRYFDADMAYQGVIRLRPEHVMARVGQIHAQIGVGMIHSAAYNLTTLLSHHPEIIAARYDVKSEARGLDDALPAGVLPSMARLHSVMNEIREMLALDPSHEPAILAAYLGYQLSLPDWVRFGLDTAAMRQPEDPLPPMLRRIWLRAPSADASPTGGPPRG